MSLPLRSALALAVAALVSMPSHAADYASIPQDEVAAAVARGAQVVHDYGSYAWVRGSGSGKSEAETFALDLGGRVFDPRVDGAANARAYADGRALRLVQFDGPIQQQWLNALQLDGVMPLQYIAPYSYVVWADRAALQRASRGAAVRWSGDFLAEYKQANVPAGLRRNENEWRVMLYRGATIGDAALRASGATIGQRSILDRHFEVVAIEAGAAALETLLQMPGVYSIEPVPRDGGLRGEYANQITANNLNGSSLPVPGYLTWLATIGVNGNGVKMANVDGGVAETNPDLVNRMLPCVGDTCGGATASSHGTHTAGIMAADGSSGTNDANGFRRGLGMAPGAKLFEQVYSGHFTQAGGMLKLMRQSHDNGADLSGNSWGPAASPRGYDGDTRQVDVGTRDTKPDIAGDQPLTYVLSFMNGNGGTSTQGTPDEAKNVITVGSTKGQTSSGAADPNIDDLSANSAHGPALDGRRIPHMVTPGCYVDSTTTASGYGLNCGTSMASPQVAGTAALFIEKYRTSHAGASPSTALIKAALVAASKNLNGRADADGGTMGHRPDNKQGWGRVRADWLLNSATPVLYYDQNTRTFDNTGENYDLTVSAADPTKPVQLVLVYTDAPGHGLGGATPAWNNDLDLSVTIGANVYRGNVFGPNGNSTTGGTADNRNNIESVVLDPAALAGGALAVRVAATNITSDALPNSGDATDQDFALVCVNCLSQPDYSLAIDDASKEVCTTTTTTANFAVNVGSLLGYTTPVALSLANVPSGAGSSVTPNSVVPGNAANVALSTLNAVTPGTHVFQLQAASTSGNRSVDLSIGVANAIPPAPSLTAPADNATAVAVRPTFTWAASPQAASYVLEVATDAAFANIVYTTTTATTSATPTADLASSTVHYWRVRADNICGTGATIAGRTFTTVAAPGDCNVGTSPRTVFSDNVEGGNIGWTASVGTGTANWAISDARPYGGSGNAWLATNPAVTSDQRLVSPAITLPVGESPLTLQFRSDQSIEFDEAGSCWDGGFLEISTDNGSTFAVIPPAAMLTDPYDGVLQTSNPASGIQAWCGDPQPYLLSIVNLNSYAGQTVKLRFRMTSDNFVGRLPHGWYVDDVRVQSCMAPLPDSIFANGFQP